MRSIEVDEELTGRRIRKNLQMKEDVDSVEGLVPEDDHSGTGHRSKKQE